MTPAGWSRLPAHPPGEYLGEMADQPRNVVGALPQGRQQDREHVQAVVEVDCGSGRRRPFGQVAVGGRHQPHIHLDRLGAAQALEFLLLQDAQQLGL